MAAAGGHVYCLMWWLRGVRVKEKLALV
jgi:hypothetical protein